MLSSKVRLLLSCLLIPVAVSSAAAEDTSYFSVKGGSFLPNGSAGPYSLKEFNTGYDAELAIGFRPESYAALELGAGLFSASGTVSTADSRTSQTIYGIPITATAKAILDLKKSELYAGAGLGYYFVSINNSVNFYTNSLPPVQESSHGSALGYHLVVGGDLKVSDRFRLGADFKWFEANPELELTNSQNVKTRAKWDVGGEILNVGFKFLF